MARKDFMQDLLVPCLFLFFFSLLAGETLAQGTIYFRTQDSVITKNKVWTTPDTLWKVKKNFPRAATEWFLIQAAPASFNYFVRKDPYSHITVKNFIQHLNPTYWDWDDNEFMTNQIAHPYHGHLYFNAFRSNGYSYTQSSLATLAGSFIWETAGETQSPSINDLVNTSFGGVVLGEMTHRVANNILSRPSYGIGRQVNEALAFLVNPMNGLNRLLDGKWGKYRGGGIRDSSFISGEFDFGLRRFDSRSDDVLSKGKNGGYGRLRFIYTAGDNDIKKPFDEFYVNIELGRDDSSLINTLNVYGLLYGREIWKKKPGRHIGTLSANYDFYRNEAFFYGAQSINFNMASTFSLGRKSSVSTLIGGGPVLLAAVPDPYLLFGASRNYNYGSGINLRYGGELNLFDRLKISSQYNGGFFFTLSGNHSNYFIHAVSSEASFKFYKNLSLNLNSGYFTLQGNFRDYEDIDKTYPFIRMSLGYAVTF